MKDSTYAATIEDVLDAAVDVSAAYDHSRVLESIDKPDATILAFVHQHGWTGEPALRVAQQMWPNSEMARIGDFDPVAAERDVRSRVRPRDCLVPAGEDWGIGAALDALSAALSANLELGGGMAAPMREIELGDIWAASPWLVRDFLPYGSASLTGPSGAGKSALSGAMIAASITGAALLGRKVPPAYWIVLSERPSVESACVLASYGVTEKLWNHYVYLGGRDTFKAKLGTPTGDARLRQVIDLFPYDLPRVLVLDTAPKLSDVALNDNDSVNELFAHVLDPLLDDGAISSLLIGLHHRKSGGRGTDAVKGATAWIEQSDFSVQIESVGKRADLGGGWLRQRMVLNRGKTGRVVADQAPEHFELHGRLEGDHTRERRLIKPEAELSTTDRIVGVLDAPIGRAPLAESVGLTSDGQAFRKGLKDALERGLIVKNDDGLYERV